MEKASASGAGDCAFESRLEYPGIANVYPGYEHFSFFVFFSTVLVKLYHAAAPSP